MIAAGVAAALVFVGAGIGARAATGGHQQVLDAQLGKFGMSAKQREAWLRGLREKVRL
jgi:truncated hemoglobin YjbI